MSNLFIYEFIWVEGGVKFMKHFKGGASYKSLVSYKLFPQTSSKHWAPQKWSFRDSHVLSAAYSIDCVPLELYVKV
jgi:hypothetical protein